MGAIRTNAAAAMLGVSPNTLRSWERRFGYPEPRRTAGNDGMPPLKIKLVHIVMPPSAA